jgi:hypothetical protein
MRIKKHPWQFSEEISKKIDNFAIKTEIRTEVELEPHRLGPLHASGQTINETG